MMDLELLRAHREELTDAVARVVRGLSPGLQGVLARAFGVELGAMNLIPARAAVATKTTKTKTTRTANPTVPKPTRTTTRTTTTKTPEHDADGRLLAFMASTVVGRACLSEIEAKMGQPELSPRTRELLGASVVGREVLARKDRARREAKEGRR